jgi:DNA-binding response OmpR family regulator
MRDKQSGAIILVLEEDQELRDGIAALLTADGYHVIAAREEGEAILRTRSERPDLILAGVSHSETDAVVGARQTRERTGCSQETPIVIFSADTLPEGEVGELADRVYLIRPDNFNQLRAFLRRIMPE